MKFEISLEIIKNTPYFIAKYGEKYVSFEIDKLYNEKNPKLIRDPDRLELLSIYINETGIGEKLMRYYLEADKIMKSRNIRSITPVITKIVKLFNYDKYMEILKEYEFNAPTELHSEVPKSGLRNGRVTEAQTYTKKDYLELLPLVGVVKAIGPIYATDIKKNIGTYPTNTALLVIANELLNIPMPKKPLSRLSDFIVGHITSMKSRDELLLVAIKRRIDIDDIPILILGNALFKRLFHMDIERNPEDTKVVKSLYSSVTSGTSTSSSVEARVSFKNLISSMDTGDKEGWGESFRQTSTLTLDEPEYFNFVASDIVLAGNDIGITITDVKGLTALGRDLTVRLEQGYRDLSLFSVWLLGIISVRILPHEGIPYLNRDNIVNLFRVCYEYVKSIGLDRLAGYMLLVPNYDVDMVVASKIDHITNDNKELLIKKYPNCKLVRGLNGGTKEEYPIIDTINSSVDAFKSELYLHLTKSEFNEIGDKAFPYRGIKNDIATLVLSIK